MADLWNEVFDDVGGTVISHILAIDSDYVGECLRVVLYNGGQQVGQPSLATASRARQQHPSRTWGPHSLKDCSASGDMSAVQS